MIQLPFTKYWLLILNTFEQITGLHVFYKRTFININITKKINFWRLLFCHIENIGIESVCVS